MTPYEPKPLAETGMDTVETSLPKASYEQYRQLCDEFSNNFRLTGIVSEEGYLAAADDEETRFVEIEGTEYPLLTPMRHVEGYDEEKCRELTGRPKILELTLPSAVIANNATDAWEFPKVADDTAIIVESGWREFLGDKRYVPVLFSGTAFDFYDPRLEDQDQIASMVLFTSKLVPVSESAANETLPDLASAFNYIRDGSDRVEGSQGSEVVFYQGDSLVENTEVVEQLWDICADRFDDMGKFHPVSMEESKEFFIEMLKDPSVGAVVAFVGEEVVSFGFSMQNFEGCSWMSPATRTELARLADVEGEDHIYFAEIVSRRGAEQKYAADVIGLYCDLISATGRGHRLAFESSNMSATYVPPIVEAYINQTATLRVEGGIPMLDKTNYWAIVS